MRNVNEWNRYHVSHILFMFAAENNPFIMNPFPTVKINNMTLDQSYLFKSSKVYNLMTLEKNKAKVDEASRLARLGELVTKRDINIFLMNILDPAVGQRLLPQIIKFVTHLLLSMKMKTTSFIRLS